MFDYFVDEHGEWQPWSKRLSMPPEVARAAGGALAAAMSPWRLAFDALGPSSTLGLPICTSLSLVRAGIVGRL